LERVLSSFTKSSFVVVMAAVILLATTGPALAGPTLAPTATGFDISFPQCTESLPPSPGFGIVGVNGGKTFTSNPCLALELTWASGAANKTPGFYANTANPGPANDTNWPTNQQTPKLCSGANSVACSYDYGWNAARFAFATAVSAEGADGATSPTAATIAAPWWLDVETANKWQTLLYGRSSATGAYDEASIEGMIASFENIGITSIGVYSTSQQWNVITVRTESSFPPVPVWIPGFGSLATAEVGCGLVSFTGGRVALTQYGSLGYDGDYACGLLSTPLTTSVSAAGSATFTSQIVSTNNDGAVTYVETGGSPALLVSGSGLVTTSGTLTPGTYVATGTTSDPNDDTGSFTFTLDVGRLIQSVPVTASVKVSGSPRYHDQLNVTGSDGTVTYVQTSGTPALVVSASGLVSTSGALTVGSYIAKGTTSDPVGDSGTFTLTVKVGALVQRNPLTATILTTNTTTFSNQLDIGANLGAVTYVQTRGTPALIVSSSGLVTTSGALTKGSYRAAGTVSDATGDVGTFTFVLTVTAPLVVPTATSVVGDAVAGRTRTLVIHGSGFYGKPLVTSHSGTNAVVTRDTGHALVVRVTVRARSRIGRYTFTILLADGESCQIRYNQH
jgi:major membrane immunogen (membrane-anchored lipoprotein)